MYGAGDNVHVRVRRLPIAETHIKACVHPAHARVALAYGKQV